MRTRSPVLTGLLHPLNLLTLGLAVFAGLVAAWWLFPVGVLFWLIMVVAVSRDPSLRISHEMQRRAPLAQRFQRYFDRIERAQVGVFNSLSTAPAPVRRTLQPIQAEIDVLANLVYALCKRMTVLENYRLVSQSRSDLEADLQQIETKINGTDDSLTRREYEESRRSLQERLSKLEAVSTQLDRVEAQLISLANEMDSIVTEVIRLQAMGHREAARFVPAVRQKLREQATQLKVFEREAVMV
jgi:chromosome segregation ATPase